LQSKSNIIFFKKEKTGPKKSIFIIYSQQDKKDLNAFKMQAIGGGVLVGAEDR